MSSTAEHLLVPASRRASAWPLARYFKLVQFVLLSGTGWVTTSLADGIVTGKEWGTLGVLSVGAAALWAKRNTADQPNAKVVVALLTVGAATLQQFWGDQQLTQTELVLLGMALLGAVNAEQVANTPPGPTTVEVVPVDAGDTDVDPGALGGSGYSSTTGAALPPREPRA